MVKRILALRQSVLVEILVILGSVVLGVGAFAVGRSAVIQTASISLERSSLQAMHWLEGSVLGKDELADLQGVAMRAVRDRENDQRFLCVIDLEGRCAVHTRNPELVGEIIMPRGLIDLETGSRPSIQSIHADQDSMVGQFTSPDGERQVAALTPMAEHGYLVGVHLPLNQALSDFHRVAVPGAALWGVFSLVFLPWVLFARRRAMLAVGARLSRILGQIPDVVWSMKGDPPALAYLSPGCEKLTGYPAEALKTNPALLRSRVDDADQSRYGEGLRALRAGRVVTEEFRFHHRDGQVIWLSLRMSPTLDSKGRLIRADGVCTEVTRRKRAEMAVREAEAHYRSLVEHADIGLVRVSASGEPLYLSPRAERISGYPSEAFQTDPGILDRAVFPEDRSKLELFLEAHRELLSTPVEAEIRYRHPSGKMVWVYQRQIPVTDDLGAIEFYDLIVMDITERKALETQLLESQKLETLGNLAAGVAHDFNNILTVISATTELMESSLASGGEIGPNLEELRRATEQAGDMVRGLLTFGPKRKMRRRECDLNEIVEDGMRVIRRVMPECIQVRVEVGEGVEAIHADSGQLQHGLLNLCLHAKETMPEGGMLTVSTGMRRIDERQAAVRPEIRPGLFVVLQVSQRVAGSVSPAFGKAARDSVRGGRQDHHPEFRLAMVYQVIREHAGWVDVRTEEGADTVVSVYLPVAGKADPKEAEPPHTRAARILVVDHEQMIAGFIKTVLERRGYRVETADGPERAMDLVSGNGGAFSAVIIDSENGDSGKLACLRRLRETRSGLGAILIGGGQPNGVLEAELAHPMTKFLEKPFQAADLAECLRALLDEEVAGV